MTAPTTHFAPTPQKLSPGSALHAVSLISVTALAGVPAFIRAAFGERTLAGVTRAAMLDVEMIEDKDYFIPHITLSEFVHEAARQSGEEDFGLLVSPHLSLRSYGCWGSYVLGASTVGEGIERAIRTVGFHSRGDRISLSVRNGHAQVAYASAAKGRDGYRHVACGAAGVILSVCRDYLGMAWRPYRVDLDIPRPRRAGLFEDVFGCPVRFDAPATMVCLDERELSYRLPRAAQPVVTLEEVARARVHRADLNSLVGVVADLIRAQVLTGMVSIEGTAHALDTSVRTLQRELNREGVDFRALTNAIRAERAKELLLHPGVSITRTSADLGYSTPAHFARAFRNATGMSPRDFQRLGEKMLSR
jgi:AraC-like DNA-binding protein